MSDDTKHKAHALRAQLERQGLTIAPLDQWRPGSGYGTRTATPIGRRR